MSDLDAVGTKDNWRCWLCDAPVDPDASVNSDLGPSADSYQDAKGKKGTGAILPRLVLQALCASRSVAEVPFLPLAS